jgi:hypothetical protein
MHNCSSASFIQFSCQMLDCSILLLAFICCALVLTEVNNKLLKVVCGWWFSESCKWCVCVSPVSICAAVQFCKYLQRQIWLQYTIGWKVLPVSQRLWCKHFLPFLLTLAIINYLLNYAWTELVQKLYETFLDLVQLFLVQNIQFFWTLLTHNLYRKCAKHF